MNPVTISCVSALCISVLRKNKKRRAKRRWWVHPLLSDRLSTGYFQTKFSQHRPHPQKFYSFYRMSVESFDELLNLSCNTLQKEKTNMRIPISPAERLVITLRYLATGSDFACLEYVYQVSRCTIRGIVRETCVAIWNILQPLEMPIPTIATWTHVVNRCYEQTQFPNCLGAIDGKHIRIFRPQNAGTEYFNYKKFHSIVLLAVTDADYCFTAIDVGAYGREADSNVFNASNFGKQLAQKQLDLPEQRALP